MAIAASFSGPNRLIYLVAPTAGLLEFNATDLYSEIVVWRNEGVAPNQHDKWISPARAIGGDIKSGDRKVGTSVFLMNNWRLVPHNSDHTIRILGDIGLDSDTNTNGQIFAFDALSTGVRVLAEYQSPNIIDTVSTSGGSGSSGATPAQIWNYGERSLTLVGNEAIATSTAAAILASQMGIAIDDIYTLLGFKPGSPMNSTDSEMIAGGKRLLIGGTEDNTTITRDDP